MAKKRSGQDVLGPIALFLIILIPVGFGIYAYWESTRPAPQTAIQSDTPVTTAPATVTSADISLNDPNSLPATTSAGELVPFSFTIQNTGNVGGQIPFKVSVKWSTGEEDVIDENVITLAAGASTVLQEQLKFELANEKAVVYLELTQTGQTAQFTIPK